MSERRLLQRITAVKKGNAILRGYSLCFHKACESDGSGKCDIVETGDPEDFVLGVVYELDQAQKLVLDRYEGLGYGYNIKTVEVIIDNNPVMAFTYYATNIDSALKPYRWYKRHVLEGALENRFPRDYVERIETVEAISDSDAERRNRELAIYN